MRWAPGMEGGSGSSTPPGRQVPRRRLVEISTATHGSPRRKKLAGADGNRRDPPKSSRGGSKCAIYARLYAISDLSSPAAGVIASDVPSPSAMADATDAPTGNSAGGGVRRAALPVVNDVSYAIRGAGAEAARSIPHEGFQVGDSPTPAFKNVGESAKYRGEVRYASILKYPPPLHR